MYNVINHSQVLFTEEEIYQVLPNYVDVNEVCTLLTEQGAYIESTQDLPTGEDYDDEESLSLDAVVELSKHYPDRKIVLFCEDVDHLAEMDSVSFEVIAPYTLVHIQNGKVQYQTSKVVWGELEDF